MLLEKLVEYSHSDAVDMPPSMYQRTPIRWMIELDAEGRLRGFVPQEGKTKRGKAMMAPHAQRAYAIKPKLLADNGEYVLGIARDPAKQERVNRCHAAFIEEVRQCADATGEPAVRAVLSFLENLDVEKLPIPDDFDAGDVMTFSVEDTVPIGLPAVQAHWREATADTGDDVHRGQCLVCGELKPVESRLPFKIKGIPDGQTAGTAMVSANKSAFESYGLKASLISPICRDCAERFAKAANSLVRGESTHIRIGPVVYAFWTREDVGFDVATMLTRPEPDEVKRLLTAAWRGSEAATEVDAAPFYALGLSASGGRVVVRDWIETTVPRVQANLARYFECQQIADRAENGPRPIGLFPLAGSLVQDATRSLPADIPRRLLSYALDGGRLPDRLLFEAVRRNRAEQGPTRPRAALIKLVVLSQQEPRKEDYMVDLERENKDPAYLCGRLLAVLEEVQSAAIPGAKATLIDRFFGSASSAPASVFGHLMRNAQPHLAKLRKERRGAFVNLDRKLGEILHELPSFPRTLSMREQALFSLGYYHQRADRWARPGRGQDNDENNE